MSGELKACAHCGGEAVERSRVLVEIEQARIDIGAAPGSSIASALEYVEQLVMVIPSVVPAWEGIESAPRDGTKILVWTVHGEVEIGHWYEVKTARYEEVEGGLFRKVEDDYYTGWNANTPLFWQPLPAAPADGGK